MPQVFKEDYGKRPLPNGGWLEIVPTTQKFFEADGTDVRLDRVREYGTDGNLRGTWLQDKMGVKFCDNLPGVEDDPGYLESLPSKERK